MVGMVFRLGNLKFIFVGVLLFILLLNVSHLAEAFVYVDPCDGTAPGNYQVGVKWGAGYPNACYVGTKITATSHDVTATVLDSCTSFRKSADLWYGVYPSPHGTKTYLLYDHRGITGDTSETFCDCWNGFWANRGTNENCCGDDGAADDFGIHTGQDITTDDVISCAQCVDAAYIAPITLYGNGYMSGLTCYHTDVPCVGPGATSSATCTLDTFQICGDETACVSCEPYTQIGDYRSCFADCNYDNDFKCAPGYHCYSPDDTCYLDVIGQPCDSGVDCTSGYCVEGICQADCNAFIGDYCSDAIYFYTTVADRGRCSGISCCEQFVDADNNNLFDDLDCVCSAAYNGFKCDDNVDGVWDGVCAWDGASWGCAIDDVYFDSVNYTNTYLGTQVDGYPCDSDLGATGFIQEGLGADDGCDTVGHIACSDGGSGSDCDTDCNSLEGNQCDTNNIAASSSFTQTGTCTNAGCTESGFVCYNAEVYQHLEGCGSCDVDFDVDPSGDTCDSSATTGGAYSPDGMCVSGGVCDTDGDVCADKGAGNLLKGDCSLCDAGSRCALSGISFSGGGHCDSDDCCVGSYLDIDDNKVFDDGAGACASCSLSSRYFRCSVDDDDVWDGKCIDYGAGYICDAQILSCMFSQDSTFDEFSTCLDSVLETAIIANGDLDDSLVSESEIIDSAVYSSEIKFSSTIDDSSLTRSTIIGSDIVSSSLTDSIVFNSQFCSGITALDAEILNNVIISGSVQKDGKSYFAPSNMNMVCSGALINSVGDLSFDVVSVRDGDLLTVYYSSTGTGYSVDVDLSELGGGAAVSLLDNGIAPDDGANDGIYTAKISSVSSGMIAEKMVSVTATVSSLINTWTVDSSIMIDNTPPVASLNILSVIGEESGTSSPTVILEMVYSDNFALDGCRVANELETNLANYEFTTCTSALQWSLEFINGTRFAFLEVRDLAGNSINVSDDIYMNTSDTGDVTAPTAPTVLDEGDFTNSQDRLYFNWFNATDNEQALLLQGVDYDLKLSDGSDFIANATILNDEFKNGVGEKEFINLDLIHGKTYSLYVTAENDDGLQSAPAASNGITTDFIAPGATSITTGMPNINLWYSGRDVLIDLTSSDVGSGIAGYSISLDKNPNVVPDEIVDFVGDAFYDTLPDGTYEFKAVAVDRAGNIGPIATEIFNVDATAPSPPRMESNSFSANDTGLLFSWYNATDITPIHTYQIQIATDANFDNIVLTDEISSAYNNYYYPGAESGRVYFAQVRANNTVVDDWSRWSSEVSGEVDFTPPVVTIVKPVNKVVSAGPVLVVNTDENALCKYGTDSSLVIYEFDLTNSNHHEVRLPDMANGTYTYYVSCNDFNINTAALEETTFTINTGLKPDLIVISDSHDTLYTNQIALVDIEVTSSAEGLGELSPNLFSIELNGAMKQVSDGEVAVADMGDGNYKVGFIVPDGDNLKLMVHLTSDMYSVDSNLKEYGLAELTIGLCDEPDDLVCPSEVCYGANDDFCIEAIDPSSDITELQGPYTIQIAKPDVQYCPGSKLEFTSGDCILIENTGDNNVCVMFADECTDSKLTGVIE